MKEKKERMLSILEDFLYDLDYEFKYLEEDYGEGEIDKEEYECKLLDLQYKKEDYEELVSIINTLE